MRKMYMSLKSVYYYACMHMYQNLLRHLMTKIPSFTHYCVFI